MQSQGGEHQQAVCCQWAFCLWQQLSLGNSAEAVGVIFMAGACFKSAPFVSIPTHEGKEGFVGIRLL